MHNFPIFVGLRLLIKMKGEAHKCVSMYIRIGVFLKPGEFLTRNPLRYFSIDFVYHTRLDFSKFLGDFTFFILKILLLPYPFQ